MLFASVPTEGERIVTETMEILPVMALPLESQGLFELEAVPVLYTGIGKVNATYALARRLASYAGAAKPLVVNFGTAGSRRFPSGTTVACRSFVQRDMDVTGLGFSLGETPFEAVPAMLEFPRVFVDLPEAVCGSGDCFETRAPGLTYDVVDMEAYALAKVCWLEGLGFASVKYITDGADHAAAQDWQANLPRAAAVFLHWYRTLRVPPSRDSTR